MEINGNNFRKKSKFLVFFYEVHFFLETPAIYFFFFSSTEFYVVYTILIDVK